jgi:enediyne biosynthesis protein E4
MMGLLRILKPSLAVGLLGLGLVSTQLTIAQSGSAVIQFEEIAAKAGLNYITSNSPTEFKNQPETMVSGVALIDFDRDGFLDIYFVGGAAIPSLKKEGVAYWNRLYRNDHNLKFSDVTEKAGVAGAGYGMGASVADFDNDGWPDIFVANVTDNHLYRNNGDGTFTDMAVKAGVVGAKYKGKKMWAVGGGWFDYNNDGLLDLFVVNYCQWEVNKDPSCEIVKGVRGYCHPKHYGPLPNSLFRNNGNGTFTDVSKQTGIAAHLGKGMSVAFADYDEDGFLDAFVANDTTPNFLFHNIAGKRFEEVGLDAGVAYGPDANALSGMGSDFRDVNNDGKPDIWHTAIEHQTFPLYVYQGEGAFTDATVTSGIARRTAEMSGWSNGVYDFDNDGWKDLFVARANVMDNVHLLVQNRKYPEPNSVFRNLGNGKFEDASKTAGADFQLESAHRGAAFGDLDNDGRVDIVVSVLNGPAKLFHNISPKQNWIALDLVGNKSNRAGLGAKVRITTEDGRQQWNDATTAVGYACSSDHRVHFGLGSNTRMKQIEIRWSSGETQVMSNVQSNQVFTIEEPKQK